MQFNDNGPSRPLPYADPAKTRLIVFQTYAAGFNLVRYAMEGGTAMCVAPYPQSGEAPLPYKRGTKKEIAGALRNFGDGKPVSPAPQTKKKPSFLSLV